MTELVLHSKRVITPDGIIEAFVSVNNGLISSISPTRPATDITELNNDVLMAGVIDPHVHINEPGRTDWEGFDTATRAALAGGITTLVDMPLNALPVTTTAAAFDIKQRAALEHLHTDCGFWGGLIPGNLPEIKPLIDKGVLGFKAFLTHSGIDEFPNVTESDLRKAMPLIAEAGLPLLVHCELDSPIKNIQWNDPKSYLQYLRSRPATWEEEAIELMIRLCETFNCRVHIVHLSSATALDKIITARQQGLPLTVETAQHYLYFDAERIANGNTAFKCAPPIREARNNARLWTALKNGVIDLVATDHSPAPPALKSIDEGNFKKAWGGIAGLQFALPVLWTAAKKHEGTLHDIAHWLCSNPAKLMGYEQSLGSIREGYVANFTIWDPEASFVLTENMIHHKHKLTPYLGEKLSGVVRQTFLHGKKVFDNGAFLHLHEGKLITAKP